MVAFRRCFFALAVVVLLSGIASAQIVGTPFTCSAAVSVPPTLRSEGFTEQIGDIVLTCTGGNTGQYPTPGTLTTSAGGPLPTANISVSLGTNVTSRLINNSVSEALLLIDEPGSAETALVAGSGPAAPQTVCSTASLGAGAGGCQQYPVIPIVGNPRGLTVMSSSAILNSNGTAAAPANIYQGNWFSYAPNQIQFLGVPILPAVSSGVTRIYRITNIRANVTGFSGAALQGTQQLNASVSISSATSVTLNQPFQTAGFVQTSLSTTVRSTNNTGFSLGSNTFFQCTKQNFTNVGLLQYSENFGTAFKTRNSVGTTGTQGATLTQNVPGVIYNSESGFEIGNGNSPLSPNGTTGLADFGTRLQAAFHNIPSGVNVWVSVNNVTNTTNVAGINGGLAALVATGPYPTSAAPDSSSTVSAGSLAGYPVIPPTTTTGGIGYVQLTVDSTGSAYAVWESIINNPAALDTYNFVYALSYSVVSGINSPPIPAGTSTVTTIVNMSYAPVPPSGSSASTITAWGTASSSLNIPRFADTSGSGVSSFAITICETTLLFPFVTNIDGFDTGLAISNTTSDPFGTNQQVGVCNLFAYGAIGQPASSPTVLANAACSSSSTATGLFCMPGTGATGYNVLPGTTSTTLASSIAPGFQGYIIAVCNFSLAHGFAFVSDVGARNLAMGYLALIVPTGTGTRSPTESLSH
jgi:hypothetical protein